MITDLPNMNGNASIDRAVDLLEIVDFSGNASYKATPNFILGFSGGNPVSTTDSQTLTNKTLTGPIASDPVFSGTVTGTYTIGGTPTFPSAVVTLTGSQTVTNKILTAPTINGGTIDNSTITVDSISGHTSGSTVTVGGLQIVSGVLNTSNSVPTAAIQANAITTAKLATGSSFTPSTAAQIPYKFSAYKNTGTQTINTGSDTKITFNTEDFDTGSNFASSTFTAPVTGFYWFNASAGYNAVGSGTRLSLQIYKNGSPALKGDDRNTNAATGTAVVMGMLSLTASDTIELYGTPVGANTVINANDTNANATKFQGFLMSAT